AVWLVVALSLGELDPTRWSDVSWTSAGAAVFLLVFDSLVGFMLYTRLLESAPAPLVSTYAYVTPLVGAVIGATVLNEALWPGALVGGVLVVSAVALELRGPMRPIPPRRDCTEPRLGAAEGRTPRFPDRLRGSLPAPESRRSCSRGKRKSLSLVAVSSRTIPSSQLRAPGAGQPLTWAVLSSQCWASSVSPSTLTLVASPSVRGSRRVKVSS